MLWYFPIPIVPLSLHALLLFILSDGDCCLFFKSPAIVPWWMGGHDTLQMCVCVCLCVSMPVQFPLISLNFRAGRSDEESSWNVAAGFTSSQQLQPWGTCMHLFVHTCIDVLLSCQPAFPFCRSKAGPNKPAFINQSNPLEIHRIPHKSPIAPW